MANQEQLDILRSGVEVWNKWIEDDLMVRLDLSGAFLSGADLSGAFLNEADLKGANLKGADLSGADLIGVYLSGADLRYADLRRADLREADLRDADLREADLLGANLFGANLRFANLFEADLLGVYLSGADLTGANLFKADLRRADLSGANLNVARLNKAYLNGADLRRAFLSGADFSKADLRAADLSGADLLGVYLSGADLRYADLRRARLIETDLYQANLSKALIVNTSFGNVDLSQVEGLDTIIHHGPSTIGIDTFYRSKGKIPEIFLRGVGVPEVFVTYLPSLMTQPIQYYSCFISYSSQDQAFAERLHADLQSKGVRCWFAPEDMKIGDKIRPTIDKSIRIHDKLLLVLSEHSVVSQWVEHEVEHALDLERERGEPVLFPVRLDRAVMDSKTGWAAKIRRERHIGEFENWKEHDTYQRGFERLLRDLKTEPE